MTKEQILQKHFTAEFGHDGHGKFMQYILDAMEEYAQQMKRSKRLYFSRTELMEYVNEQPPTDQPEQLLTIQEAAEFLSLTVSTMYSKCSKGELPVMKRGKRLYFSQPELMAYIKAGRKKSNAEIEAEADAYLSNKKKGLNNGK